MNEHIVSNKGITLTKKLIEKSIVTKIKKELTVSPYTTLKYYVKSFKVFTEDPLNLTIPLYYALTNCPELKFIDSFSINKKMSPISTDNLVMRPQQQECLDIVLKELEKPFGGGILNLSTASGKTPLTLEIISKFSQSSSEFCNGLPLIIVDKIELMSQWTKEINKFLPGARIGYIQGKNTSSLKCPENFDILIAMINTIALKKELIDFNCIGISFIDEVHTVSSEVFSKVMAKVRPRYTFGLTATLERKDRLEKIIYWNIGPVLYSNVSSERKQKTEIHIYPYSGTSSEELYLKNGDKALSRMLSKIAEDLDRNNMIVDILKELIKSPERNILVVSDRKEQLRYLHSQFKEDSGLFMGNMKSDILEETKQKKIVFGIYSLVNQGFNLPKLNCLLFASPRSSITQCIGRIYRKDHDIPPIIIDIHDKFSIYNGQFYKRKKIYKESISSPLFLTKNIGNCTQESDDICVLKTQEKSSGSEDDSDYDFD